MLDRYVPDTLDNTNAPKIISALCANEEIAVKFGKKFEGALPNKVEKKGNDILLTMTVRNRKVKILIDYNGRIIESPDEGFNKTCSNECLSNNLCTAKNNQPGKHGAGLDLPGQKCFELPVKVLGPGPKRTTACLCRFGTIELYIENAVDTESETCIRYFAPISIERAPDSTDNSLVLKNAESQTLIYDPETRQGTLLPA